MPSYCMVPAMANLAAHAMFVTLGRTSNCSLHPPAFIHLHHPHSSSGCCASAADAASFCCAALIVLCSGDELGA